ncbi:MAG TPA: response regulator transcription factor [Cryomorphaceae bacterium]|nr:response regulator transcription factor [Cryomorphaceae bacterium]
MQILLVDDHAILMDGLKFLLKQEENVAGVITAKTVAEAFDLLESHPVDLIISDISVPEEGGVSFIGKVKKYRPDMKVIFLSMHEEPYLVKEALATGAEGYVLKRAAHSELIQAVVEVMAGRMFFSDDIQKILIRQIQFPDDERFLTNREKEILSLIFEEYSNKAIGDKLNISERTVETHRKNIYQKTKTNTVVGLLKFAMENNLVGRLI